MRSLFVWPHCYLSNSRLLNNKQVKFTLCSSSRCDRSTLHVYLTHHTTDNNCLSQFFITSSGCSSPTTLLLLVLLNRWQHKHAHTPTPLGLRRSTVVLFRSRIKNDWRHRHHRQVMLTHKTICSRCLGLQKNINLATALFLVSWLSGISGSLYALFDQPCCCLWYHEECWWNTEQERG